METKSQDYNRMSTFIRLMVLVVPLFLIAIYYEKVSLFIIAGFLFAGIYFLLFRKSLWVLLVLTPVSLTLGKVIDIPISGDWVYEARAAEIFLLIVTFLFFLDSYLNRKIMSFRIDFISFVLYLYLLAATASILYAVDFRFFVFGMKVVVYSFLSYFLARQIIDSKKKIEYFLYGLAITEVVLSLQVFFKFYSLGFSSAFFFERNTILLPIGPIATTAAIMALIAPVLFAFYFQLNKGRMARPFILTAALIGVTAVFLTLGKGAIASLIIGLTYLFIKLKNARTPFLLLGLWFVFISIVLLNPILSGLFERIKTTFVDTNTQFRILEYQTSYELVKEHPYIGAGVGQQLYYFKEMLNYETSQLVNNYFLQALIDLGVIGLGLVSALFLGIINKGIVAVKKSMMHGGYYIMLLYGFSASLIVAFFNGLVEVTFYALPYAIIIWLMIGVYVNVQNLAKTFTYHK